MDRIDKQIIDILQYDGRASNAAIARDVGVSEGTVRRRLKKLIDEDYIKVIAITEPTKMGMLSEGLVGIQTDLDMIDSVADELTKIDEINWVTVTTGAFDIFVWATLQSAEALGVFLRTRIATIPGVTRTETFVNLSVRKRGHGVATLS